MKAMVGLVMALASSVCATATTTADPGRLRSISYETQPCFFGCATYRVTVNADGTGLFEGRARTAVIGERRFSVTQAQFRAFAAQLAPARPAAGQIRYEGSAMCESMSTDQDSVAIVWRGASEQRLFAYYGCDMQKNEALFERLRTAPALLPIRDFIGRRR